MRKQWILSAGVAVVAGALGRALVSPTPLGAVAKEIVELLADSSQLLQGQRDMQSSMDTKMSELRTLVQQQSDNSNKLAGSIAAMQKTVQDLQANSQAQLQPPLVCKVCLTPQRIAGPPNQDQFAVG